MLNYKMTGNPRRGKFPSKLLWSENADLKLSASRGVKNDNKKPTEQRENRSSQQRQRRQQETEKRLQRPQTCTEASTKYHNTPPTKLMKRGNTDCRRFKKMPPIEFATKAKLHFSPALPSLIFYGPPPSFARFCDPCISS